MKFKNIDRSDATATFFFHQIKSLEVKISKCRKFAICGPWLLLVMSKKSSMWLFRVTKRRFFDISIHIANNRCHKYIRFYDDLIVPEHFLDVSCGWTCCKTCEYLLHHLQNLRSTLCVLRVYAPRYATLRSGFHILKSDQRH